MKLVAIAGSIAEESFNRQLLVFAANQYAAQADIEVLNINDVPVFNQDEDTGANAAVLYLARKIEQADGVIFATPEHNHTLAPAMKNIIEWLSNKLHPLANKPVLILGASWHDQGSSRAQLSLRQVLEAPGVGALVMPGDEFLLANAKDAFDELGNLKDQRTVAFLGTVITKFVKWVHVLAAMQEKKAAQPWLQEDLTGHHPVDTSIDLPRSDDWVEQGAAKTGAVNGDKYVELDRGLLTVDQLNWFLNSMPMELTYMDDNDQFIYYNHALDHDDMLASRYPKQVGDMASEVHPPRAVAHVQQVIWALRQHQTDLVSMPVPGNKVNEKYIMHFYRAMRDADDRYRGVNEWVLDIWPIIADYLKRTGQKLVQDPSHKADATTGASQAGASAKPDASTGASESTSTPAATPTPDASTGASESSATPTPTPDASTGASESGTDTAADASTSASKADASTGASESVPTPVFPDAVTGATEI
ncbi:NADPH-dependent oxidoreductase [Lacticaseibacillus mingshuiensis]|uniref:NAD(P)H-dependent oxidoreductase n=1 Tax=Lacticaseibacillus mingshuiensis TaxID=2799574 RepID=A0ABW4CGE9_9LACO|nr:NADPH-dependent oxidoreductase [Lacticaseibacillus mingshuiensis]